jgi:hypothetical protein
MFAKLQKSFKEPEEMLRGRNILMRLLLQCRDIYSAPSSSKINAIFDFLPAPAPKLYAIICKKEQENITPKKNKITNSNEIRGDTRTICIIYVELLPSLFNERKIIRTVRYIFR